jgi:hypothetical protein
MDESPRRGVQALICLVSKIRNREERPAPPFRQEGARLDA